MQDDYARRNHADGTHNLPDRADQRPLVPGPGLSQPTGAQGTTTRVLVIYTGGTIGSVPSDPADLSSPLRPTSPAALEPFIANPLGAIHWDLVSLEDKNGAPEKPFDSSLVTPRHWDLLARHIRRFEGSYDGLVVLHGTDTLAYTGSALAFLLQGLRKPVVLTGSQLPIFEPGTDAVQNFTNALKVAGYKATGLAFVPEVLICFGASLLRACRTTKVSTSSFQAFASPCFPELGRLGETISLERGLIRAPSEGAAESRLEPGVIAWKLTPGASSAALITPLTSSDIKGIVLETFGAGNGLDDDNTLQAIREAAARGKLIVNVSQCLGGRVQMGHYAASSALLEAGVLSGGDMTTEAALAKVMWLLGSKGRQDRARFVSSDLCGELTG